MNHPYGPWATAIDAGRNPQLSAFWRQRLTMLVPTSETSPVLSRRNALLLVTAAVCLFLLPTFRPAPADAQQQAAADKARVEGTVMFGGMARSGIEVELILPGPIPDNPQRIKTTSDAAGRFVFPDVRPGKAEIDPHIGLKSGEEFRSLALCATVELKPGELRNVVFGGHGRPVVGRLRMPANWKGSDFKSVRIEYFLRPPPFFLDDGKWPGQDEWNEFLKSELGKGFSGGATPVAADGRFRLPRVPAGKFHVRFFILSSLAGEPELNAVRVLSSIPCPAERAMNRWIWGRSILRSARSNLRYRLTKRTTNPARLPPPSPLVPCHRQTTSP